MQYYDILTTLQMGTPCGVGGIMSTMSTKWRVGYSVQYTTSTLDYYVLQYYSVATSLLLRTHYDGYTHGVITVTGWCHEDGVTS